MTNNEDIKNILGSAIKELRIKKGITQERLAEFLGVQPPTIAKIETGKRFVSSELLAKLCNFFNVDAYVFLLKKNQTYTPEDINHFAQINTKLDRIYDIVKEKKK